MASGDVCGEESYASDGSKDKNISNITLERPKKSCKFYQEGNCRFGDECFNLHEGSIRQKIDKVKSVGEKEVKVEEMEENSSSKKPPLRTAGDVRRRIQWDEQLPSEYFSVGYLERFIGVLEQPFSTFKWEHPALAEIEDLTIPEHRIQYFKYKGEKVWDKNERLDDVYGSGGKEIGRTIVEVMDEIDERLAKVDPGFDSEESDSDDEVIVGSCSNALQDAKINEERKRQLRATHFLCIKVNSEEVKSQIKLVQEHITSEDRTLLNTTMPLELLHVTLAMMRCETAESIEEVSTLLTSLNINEFKESDSDIIIKARKLATFGSRVIYSQLEVPLLFTKVTKFIHEKLVKMANATITNHFDFVPHLTLLKVNRVVMKNRMSKYVSSSTYDRYYNHQFGQISFDNIHFCEISDIRGVDHFYTTIDKIEF